MSFLSPQSGYIILLSFGAIMVIMSLLQKTKPTSSQKEDFLLANRKTDWLKGSASIAASWIWAPALFVSVQMAYEKGLAGLLWFTAPNIFALIIFAFLAPRIRKKFPEGYTLPQYIQTRFQSKRLHTLYLFPYFFYQLMAVTVQLFAGGNFVSLLTGIPLTTVMPLLLAIAVTYTLISGLRASILTDFIQLIMIFGIGAIILPLVWQAGGGLTAIQSGFAGTEGITNIFDPGVAFSFGIVTSIGLIAGAISDQQYWQRSFAIKKTQLRKSFIIGGILFGIVPLALSILGFIAINPDLAITLPQGIDSSMIGVQTVATLLPSWAVLLFILMLLSGLSSTLDSGLIAASSLWVTDVSKQKSEKNQLRSARLAMIGIGLLGLAVAYIAYYIPEFGLKHLWWIFNTIAACVLVPTILALYKKTLNEKGVFWGILIAFIFGIPLFIYSNIINNETWIVGSSLFVIAISTVFALIPPKPQSSAKPHPSHLPRLAPQTQLSDSSSQDY